MSCVPPSYVGLNIELPFGATGEDAVAEIDRDGRLEIRLKYKPLLLPSAPSTQT